MRIPRLELIDFRNHEHSVIDFGDAKICAILGPTHQGKSSVGQGLSMGLTPSTDGLDLKGAGYDRKIRHGQNKATIAVDVQGAMHRMRQTVTLNMNTSGRTSRSTCMDDPEFHPLPFEQFLEQSKTALSVALNTDYFLYMLDEARQKALLASLVLPDRYEFPADKIIDTEKCIGKGAVNFASDPLAAIDAAYKKLYEERTVINRQVKGFQIPDSLPIPQGCDSASLQARIEQKRTEKQKLIGVRDGKVKQASDANAKRARMEERATSLQERITGEHRRLDENAKLILSPAKVKEYTAVAANAAMLSTKTAERMQVRGEIGAKKALLDKLENTPDPGSQCPTCYQIVSGSALVTLADVTAREQRALEARETQLWDEIRALGNVDAAKQEITNHERAVAEKGAIESIIIEKKRELDKVTKDLSALPAVAAVDSDNTAIGEVEKTIEAIQNQLRPVIAAEERAKEIALKREELKALTAKQGLLNELVAYFDKDGVKARLLGEHIGGFIEKTKPLLEAWGYEMQLSIEPWECTINGQYGPTPLKELSGSEKLMFSWAFQCAVTQAAGIGFTVLDRMDTLTIEERGRANDVLREMTHNGMLDQVFVIIMKTTPDIPEGLPADIAFYFVENGSVRRL